MMGDGLERGPTTPVDWLTMTHTRTYELGPATRPVAVPEGMDDASVAKAAGRIELPLHIRWSGPPIIYDLDDRADRARVYEQVLREGTESVAAARRRSVSVSPSPQPTGREPDGCTDLDGRGGLMERAHCRVISVSH